MKRARYLIATLVGVLMLPSVAAGHGLETHAGGLAGGMAHPLSGWDHLVGLLAVGIWIAQMRPDMSWKLSGAFIAALLAGSVAGMALVPPVPGGLISSLAVVGLLIALGARPAPFWGLVSVTVFGVFHGLAHGAGVPASLPAFAYLGGLLLVSLHLQILSAVVVRASRRVSWPLLRLAGGLLAGGSIGVALL